MFVVCKNTHTHVENVYTPMYTTTAVLVICTAVVCVCVCVCIPAGRERGRVSTGRGG